MKMDIASDARPHVRTLLLAVAVTVVLGFIPFADLLTYPFRLFVTFIHEGGHALAALLTGGGVHGLSVAPDGSGLTYTSGGGLLARLLVASAGYLGAMAYGAALLVLIRRAVAARAVLAGSGACILALALVYGFGSLFTMVAGATLALGLLAAARYAGPRVAGFLVSFLAVQCVVGALFDLRTVLALSAPFAPAARTDAANMAAATGIPAIVWAALWIILALAMLFVSLRAYAADRPVTRRPPLGSRGRLGA